MSFTSPMWLLGLLPWICVLLWLLLKKREQTAVPFLPLWDNNQPHRRPRKTVRPPSPALAAALAVSLAAIIAAAGPTLSLQDKSPQSIQIIVDRGLTMSAANPQGQARFIESAHQLDAVLRRELTSVSIELRMIPGESAVTTDIDHWLAIIDNTSATAVTDPAAITLAANAAVYNSSVQVVVLSDQLLKFSDSRITQISPQSPLVNVGIESFTARLDPHPAAMVRLFNQSPLTSATILLQGDENPPITLPIQLPRRGASQNYFLDFSTAATVLEVQIQANDNPALDHHAWLVRQSAWPRIEPRSSFSPDLRRMIDVYSRLRPPTSDSQPIAVVDSPSADPQDESTAIAISATDDMRPVDSTAITQIAVNAPDLSAINWQHIASSARVAPIPPGDWTPIVSAGSAPMVAIRVHPKSIWVGFDSPNFTQSPDFVILWSRVFDWLAGGNPTYASLPINPLTGHWTQIAPEPTTPQPPTAIGLTPGLYKSADGALRAVNARAPALNPSPPADGQSHLIQLLHQSTRRNYPMLPLLILFALALAILASILWPSTPRRASATALP